MKLAFGKEFAGELIGTYILVLFGCGSVAVSLLFNAFSLFQVAIIWGLGVALGIFASRPLSNAHLNPAVSIAMLLAKKLHPKQLLSYLPGQFAGAFLAATTLWVLFNPSIVQFEQYNDIVRGAPASIQTAMMFGEFYPNPGFFEQVAISTPLAFGAEAFGTFILVLAIFCLTTTLDPKGAACPILIGLTVSLIICLIAPLTQAGLNPARDLAPRLFAWMAGWGDAAFPPAPFGALIVYVIGPIVGGSIAVPCFKLLFKPSKH